MAREVSGSLPRPGHVYGSNTIAGRANVQFGDVINHYSPVDANVGINNDSLVNTLHGLFEQSFVSQAPPRARWSVYLRAFNSKLEYLESVLARLQRIEQKGMDGRDGRYYDRKSVLDLIVAEGQVAHHQAVAKALQLKLAVRARALCSNTEGLSCVDPFCDYLERLSRQITARANTDRAFEDVHLKDINDSLNSHAEDQAEEIRRYLALARRRSDSPSSRFVISCARDYLDAIKDFWIHLTSILEALLNIRKMYRKITLLQLLCCFSFTRHKRRSISEYETRTRTDQELQEEDGKATAT